LEKNGRARLLPSYFRIKLGRSLALPMKLKAIPKGKLYDFLVPVDQRLVG